MGRLLLVCLDNFPLAFVEAVVVDCAFRLEGLRSVLRDFLSGAGTVVEVAGEDSVRVSIIAELMRCC